MCIKTINMGHLIDTVVSLSIVLYIFLSILRYNKLLLIQ